MPSFKSTEIEEKVIAFLSIIAVGFFLGMRHATDPDHVIAVATIVSRQRNLTRAALIGAFWGLGHTVTIFVVGAGIILFNLVIPVRVGLSMELSVGVMLIVLGVMNVAGFLRSLPGVPFEAPKLEGQGEIQEEETQSGDPDREIIVHSHAHSHGDYIHNHRHVHDADGHAHRLDRKPAAFLTSVLARFGAYQHLRPLTVGIVHGLAGSAAVALLVLTTIRNARWAIAYLLVFGAGTMAGMMVITLSLASTLQVAAARSQYVAQKLGIASGLLSLAFGFLVVYQIGFVSGLFTAHPLWTPK